VRLCKKIGVFAVNVSAGSPYYSAHIQRPAAFPPIDSLELRQDPLIGVIRQIQAVRAIKEAVPDMPLIGSGYSYLQEYLPNTAQGEVRGGHVDLVGLGRMALACPTLPEEVLSRGELNRAHLCRTFSDCTNGPRMGYISGCYPLDPDYKALPEWSQIRERKKQMK
jgi:2,4-dienoyl-CoA reductase-like NADH-dependent reductase (Old Yellow Enzyme family)